jgi:hypothetical protein
MFDAIPTDREVWVELWDRSVRAHLSEWHQVQRGPFTSDVAWVGRVQYERPTGGQFDGLVPERFIREA